MSIETVYTVHEFRTKKALKDEVASGIGPMVYTVGMSPRSVPDGVHVIVGPSPYQRKWYGNVRVEGGCIVKVVK